MTTRTSNQLRAELQNFNLNASAVVSPRFLAISEYDDTTAQVLRWHCFPIFSTKEQNGQVSHHGIWGNYTGRTIKSNYVLVCGKTSAGTIPAQEWLENHLNKNATGDITLEHLCNIPYVFFCIQLDAGDMFTVPENKTLRITAGIGY